MKRMNKAIAGLMAAMMLSTSPAWAGDKREIELPEKSKETYEELLDAVPQLKEYSESKTYNKKGYYAVFLKKQKNGDNPSAYIYLDQKTGDLHSFVHVTTLEPSTEGPSDDLAREKATDFLKAVLDEQFDELMVKEVKSETKLIDYDDENGEDMEVERAMKRVIFSSQKDSKPEYSVMVDKSGEIFEVVNEKAKERENEQKEVKETDLDKTIKESRDSLFAAVPELKEESYVIRKIDRTQNNDIESIEQLLDREFFDFSTKKGTRFKIDNNSKEINYLDIITDRKAENNPITEEVAKVKAAQFLQQVIKNSERYAFVGVKKTYFYNTKEPYLCSGVGFTRPLDENKDYVKHLVIYIDQSGKIAAVRSDVKKASYNFDGYYNDTDEYEDE